jgi:hypothetical protein
MYTTADELRAIKALKRVAQRWPKTLWLFAGDGYTVSILKVKDDGTRAMTPSGGTDPAYLVGRVNIPNDGGDW